MSRNITTSRWFVREEINLMRQCIEALLSGRFVEEEDVFTLTGWYIDELRCLIDRFDIVRYEERSLTLQDFQMIFQTVLCLSNYLIDRLRELESLLGMPILHLSWFLYRLYPFRNEWDKHVQNDSKQSRRASTIP